MKSLLLAAMMFAIGGTIAQADVAPPMPRDQLSGEEIGRLFSGTSMYGIFTADGARWGERTTREGHVVDLLKGGRESGAWAVDEAQICYVYYGRPASHLCYKIEQEGSDVLFIDSKTNEMVARATRVLRSKR